MPITYEGLGIEEVVDRVVMTLREKLNGQLEIQVSKWEPKDRARAQALGIDYVPITLEPVSPDGFHVGNVPSLVRDDLPLESYPYVAVTPEDASPDPEDARHDQRNVYQDLLTIHTIAKSSKSEGAEFAFRRAARMAEAVYAVVEHDPQLRRMIQGASNPMRVRISEPFVFSPEGIDDMDYYWQAAGSQYAVKTYTMPPEEV
jgi:hypothetical protein